MVSQTEFASTTPALVSSQKNGAQNLRLVGFGAAFAAAWLAMSVARKPGLSAERRITPRKDNVPGPVRLASHAASAISYPAVYLPLAGIIAIRLREIGTKSASAVPRSALAAWLAYHAIKTATHRERPPSEQGNANDDRSYPSGHATAAAAIATSAAYLSLRDRPSQWTTILPAAFGVPLAVGASRVALGKHWPTDVLGGFATGVAVAAYTTSKRVAGSDGDRRSDAS